MLYAPDGDANPIGLAEGFIDQSCVRHKDAQAADHQPSKAVNASVYLFSQGNCRPDKDQGAAAEGIFPEVQKLFRRQNAFFWNAKIFSDTGARFFGPPKVFPAPESLFLERQNFFRSRNVFFRNGKSFSDIGACFFGAPKVFPTPENLFPVRKKLFRRRKTFSRNGKKFARAQKSLISSNLTMMRRRGAISAKCAFSRRFLVLCRRSQIEGKRVTSTQFSKVKGDDPAEWSVRYIGNIMD